MAINYFAGIHDLGYVFSKAAYAGGISAVDGDGLGVGLNLAAAGGKFGWYLRSNHWKQEFDDAKNDPYFDKHSTWMKGAPTAIIDSAVPIVVLTDFLVGFGSPYAGSEFSTAEAKWETFDLRVGSAAPDPRDWNGPAANAYAEQQQLVNTLAQRIGALEKIAQRHFVNHSESVRKAHDAFAGMLCIVIAAQAIAIKLFKWAGIEKSLEFQTTVFFLVMMMIATTLIIVQDHSYELENVIHSLAERYQSITDEVAGMGLGPVPSSAISPSHQKPQPLVANSAPVMPRVSTSGIHAYHHRENIDVER